MANSLSHTDWFVRQTAKALLPGALVVLGLQVESQTTFNFRYDLGGNGLLGQVELFPDCYMISGLRTPSNTAEYQQNLIVLKIDQNGQVIDESIFGNPGEKIQPFPKCSYKIENSETTLCATTRYDLNINNQRCCVFNINQDLEIAILGEYISPYYTPDDFNSASALPQDIKAAPDGSIYLTFAIFQPGSGNHFTVLKILPSGVVDWEYVYATEGQQDFCSSLLFFDNQLIFVVLSATPPLNQDPTIRLIKLDDNGEEIHNSLIQEFISGAAYDILQIDGDFIIASAWYPQLQSTVVPQLYRMSSGGSLVWQSTPSMEFNAGHYMLLVDRTTDGNIISAAQYHQDPQGDYYQKVHLFKHTPDGDTLWTRKLYFDEGDCVFNIIYDLKATPDGGVIFCGEAKYCETGTGPFQQGWVVKLDSCGCLVPGCDPNCIIDNVAEQSQAKEALMVVGPNPTTGSEFYVHIRASSEQRAANSWMRIYDLQGREVKNIRLRGEGTYAVGCADWPGGVYLVSLVADGRVLETLKVVRE